jgi:hypothetical protein
VRSVGEAGLRGAAVPGSDRVHRVSPPARGAPSREDYMMRLS